MKVVYKFISSGSEEIYQLVTNEIQPVHQPLHIIVTVQGSL